MFKIRELERRFDFVHVDVTVCVDGHKYIAAWQFAHGPCLREVNVCALNQHWRGDHKNDEQNEGNIDKRRDVDFSKSVFVVVEPSEFHDALGLGGEIPLDKSEEF